MLAGVPGHPLPPPTPAPATFSTATPTPSPPATSCLPQQPLASLSIHPLASPPLQPSPGLPQPPSGLPQRPLASTSLCWPHKPEDTLPAQLLKCKCAVINVSAGVKDVIKSVPRMFVVTGGMCGAPGTHTQFSCYRFSEWVSTPSLTSHFQLLMQR